MRVGDKYGTNSCGELEVVKYINRDQVLIRFIETGFERFTQACAIRCGSVKDLLSPSAYAVGFLGDGRHKASIGGKSTDAYKSWRSMLRRCYCPKWQELNPTYEGCVVASEWLNFQVFAGWYEENHIEGYQLDKDLIAVGNKLYCPEFCAFVDGKTNNFTIDHGRARGDHMVGVCGHKSSKVFRANCRNPFTNKREHLGLFSTELEAHEAWRARKHALALILADEQQDKRVADALRVRYLPSNRITGEE